MALLLRVERLRIRGKREFHGGYVSILSGSMNQIEAAGFAAEQRRQLSARAFRVRQKDAQDAARSCYSKRVRSRSPQRAQVPALAVHVFLALDFDLVNLRNCVLQKQYCVRISDSSSTYVNGARRFNRTRKALRQRGYFFPGDACEGVGGWPVSGVDLLQRGLHSAGAKFRRWRRRPRLRFTITGEITMEVASRKGGARLSRSGGVSRDPRGRRPGLL